MYLGACRPSGSASNIGYFPAVNSTFLDIPGHVVSVGVPRIWEGGGGGGKRGGREEEITRRGRGEERKGGREGREGGREKGG